MARQSAYVRSSVRSFCPKGRWQVARYVPSLDILEARITPAGIPFFEPPPIDQFFNAAKSVDTADLDGDGDLDVLGAAGGIASDITWWENTAGDGSAWADHDIEGAFQGANHVTAADLDGDGDLDVLATAETADDVVWWENTSGDGSAWTEHVIADNFLGANRAFAADLDGDGDLDVLGAASQANDVTWWENLAGDGVTWTEHTIDGNFDGAFSVAAADLDGDGDLDVVAAGINADAVRCWENTLGDGSDWFARTITTGLDSPVDVVTGDVDGDGDLDVISAAQSADDVTWYQNRLGDGTSWLPVTIDGFFDGARSVAVADLDGDGDLDVYGAAAGAQVVAWWENTTGFGSAWTRYTVDEFFNGAWDVAAADVDGDGDLDLLGAASISNDIAWYRNDTIHRSALFDDPTSKLTIDSTFGGAHSVFTADVDGDGDLDMIGAALFDDDVTWWENTAGDGSAWTEHVVDANFDGAFSVYAADVDGDGDVDILAAGSAGDAVAWWENTAGDGSAWTEQTIATGFDGAASVHAADVDGDGDLDVLGAALLGDAVTWWENSLGDGSAWTEHTIDAAFDGAVSVQAADVDGDGDLDVLAAALTGGSITWWENTAGNGTAWTERSIDSAFAGAISAHAADVDGDGDLDVLGASLNLGDIAWWENTTGDGTAWTEHLVDGNFAGAQSAYASDLDGDGDLDILGVARTADQVTWWENTVGDGTAWTTHAVDAAFNGAFHAHAADLNRDGQLDILAAAIDGAEVAWWRNRGGQFAMTTSTPGSIMALGSGELTHVLNIDLFHRGRPGDHAVELASVELLFEESAGDPLTSAEANALVDNVYLYRDANDNGTFEADADQPVAAVFTLVLDAGRQSMLLYDGDPNAQTVEGGVSTYFVVIELAPDAGSQTPNQFRITHLTESSSRAEDAAADIPLSMEFAANVSTGPLGAPPPVGVGVYRDGTWFLDTDNDRTLDETGFAFDGEPGGVPVVGDWNGDGFKEVGIFRDGTWRLDTNSNNQFDAGVDAEFVFGNFKFTPVVGDWDGDGDDELGLFKKGKWFLDLNDNGLKDDAFFIYGNTNGGELPVVGDWDGDGDDEVGVFKAGKWKIDLNSNRTKDDGKFFFGVGTELPVVGDWNGDDVDDLALFLDGLWTLDDGDRAASTGDAVFTFGQAADIPVTGRWQAGG